MIWLVPPSSIARVGVEHHQRAQCLLGARVLGEHLFVRRDRALQEAALAEVAAEAAPLVFHLQVRKANWSMLLIFGLAGGLGIASIGDRCGAHTFPYLDVQNTSATVEHEASTSKIGEDQIFYCQQRGLADEDAVSMIVNGFCKEVFQELPMEFAVEAQKLLGISLEGSVG